MRLLVLQTSYKLHKAWNMIKEKERYKTLETVNTTVVWNYTLYSNTMSSPQKIGLVTLWGRAVRDIRLAQILLLLEGQNADWWLWLNAISRGLREARQRGRWGFLRFQGTSAYGGFRRRWIRDWQRSGGKRVLGRWLSGRLSTSRVGVWRQKCVIRPRLLRTGAVVKSAGRVVGERSIVEGLLRYHSGMGLFAWRAGSFSIAAESKFLDDGRCSSGASWGQTISAKVIVEYESWSYTGCVYTLTNFLLRHWWHCTST